MTESTQADKQRCTKWILKDENDQFNRNTTSCCLRFFTLHLCSWYYYYEIITHFNVTSDQRSNEVLLSWSSNAHKKIHYLLIVFSLLICLRVQTKFPFFFLSFLCVNTHRLNRNRTFQRERNLFRFGLWVKCVCGPYCCRMPFGTGRYGSSHAYTQTHT